MMTGSDGNRLEPSGRPMLHGAGPTPDLDAPAPAVLSLRTNLISPTEIACRLAPTGWRQSPCHENWIVRSDGRFARSAGESGSTDLRPTLATEQLRDSSVICRITGSSGQQLRRCPPQCC
jgi:hypothetical protein